MMKLWTQNHSRRWLASLACIAGAATLSGCRGERIQSTLHPSGPAAESIATLWWVMFGVLGAYTLAVFALTLIAIFRRPSKKMSSQYGEHRFILLGGVIVPTAVLIPLLIYSLTTTTSLQMPETGLTIRVVGHRWWWEVEYPDQQIVMANELIIPAGEPVRLELTSADVIHSFWVPQLHGKMDMIPGLETEFWIEANRPGVYRGQCGEFCGLQHALMAFEVIVLPPDEFADWLNQHSRAAPPSVAGNLDLERGQELFFRHGCAVCHAIAGTRAVGVAGPDLTMLATRRTLAAATIPNTSENLLAWLVDPQVIKPHANMPATHATLGDLKLIVAFIQSLDGKGGDRGTNE
jgi:cytochrome c oxidase subunit II